MEDQGHGCWKAMWRCGVLSDAPRRVLLMWGKDDYMNLEGAVEAKAPFTFHKTAKTPKSMSSSFLTPSQITSFPSELRSSFTRSICIRYLY